jgi:hypothetical protein
LFDGADAGRLTLVVGMAGHVVGVVYQDFGAVDAVKAETNYREPMPGVAAVLCASAALWDGLAVGLP